jgi:hypothetical protein
MVGKITKAEFEREGIKSVREHVKSGDYWEGKKQAAIKWLEEQAARKQSRDTKALLKLARRTARDTRLTLVLAGLILLVLIAIAVRVFLH